MLFFQKYIEFVDADNRSLRPHTPVTVETLTYKHEAMAPAHIIKDKTILDLGSCLGATGHWCLSHGAASYTGIEFQKLYVEKSTELLLKYWDSSKFEIIQTEIEDFLKTSTKKYDVVFACGVLYGFLNTVGILELIAKSAEGCILIDSSYPTELTHYRSTVIDIPLSQNMIRSEGVNGSYMGIGARPSPTAVARIMKNFGFENKEKVLIFPKKITDPDVHDAYHNLINRQYGIPTPSRFILRFVNIYKKQNTVVENLISNQNIGTLPPVPPLAKDAPKWEFDKSVADRFQQEAEKHIPDYQKVIDLQISIIDKKFKRKDVSIMEVGSALGHTLDNLYSNGFNNFCGVECSTAMIDQSKYKDKIIQSFEFPAGSYDVVMANWTVHFIKEKEKYLTSIFDSLNDNGILMLSDKMTQHPVIKEMYYQWKMSNGVTIDEIKEKEKKLIGIMLAETLEAYLEMLHRIGFTKVDLINSRFNFNTLLCCK
jgi:2-polyprenyl-3-methyl-5-hydroxy-6-metoxy-1,4-benzoquinol methylase